MNFSYLHGGRRARWGTILGIVLVPFVVAGALLWGLWNPAERLDSVNAAVVNLDEPVTVDGEMLPMGRLLAGELIGDDAPVSEDSGADSESGGVDTNFTWVLTDEADAEAGIDDGRYATVVTIPENFSEAATSASRGADEAERATIDVQTSERGRLLDPALSNIVTTTATTVLNETLGTQFVGNVFVGMTQLGEGIGDAADGAHQLADGGASLADGADELADGTQQLSAGVQQLASGAGELAAGAQQAADGSALLAKKGAEYTQGVTQALTGLQQGAAGAIAPLQQLYAAIEADEIALPDGQDKAETLAQLDQLISGLQGSSSDSPQNPITQLKGGGAALAEGMKQSAAGSAQLAAGANQLSSGVGALAAQTPGLAEGTAQLAEGARQAADGTAGLAEGLDQAADGVPQYTDAQREKMAGIMVAPVEANGAGGELFNAAGVPLFAGIALWAGALAAFLVLAPLWRRTREAARGIGYITWRSTVPALIVGALQGAIAGIVLPPLLGYSFSQGLGFFSLALVAGISFALVNQGLSALFGGIGRFVSFALLVIAFAIGVISTAPPILQSIGDASPIGALFSGFQAIAMGASGGGAAIGTLVLWGVGGVILTAFAAGRQRRRIGLTATRQPNIA